MSEDPLCARCNATSSVIWQRDQGGAIICLDCLTAEKNAKLNLLTGVSDKVESSSQNGKQSSSVKPTSKSTQQSSSGVTTRRTTRSHERAKARQQEQQQQQQQQQQQEEQQQDSSSPAAASPGPPINTVTQPIPTAMKPDASKGSIAVCITQEKLDTPSPAPSGNGNTTVTSRSRRSLRQSQSVHAAEQRSYVVTSNSIQHMGVNFEVGDIVSLLDRDGGVYYAVAQGFMLDQYAHKCILLTWLLPKMPNPTHFDPAMFILGPEDDTPRSMDFIEFVCHSPQSRHFQGSYLHNINQAELWLTSNR